MAEDSKISWTDHTYNPWLGCHKIAPECQNCYAESLCHRFGHAEWGPKATRNRTDTWRDVEKWQRRAERVGSEPIIFCGSLCDVFEDNRQLDSWREELWPLVARCDRLDWLLLTKRPGLVNRMIPTAWMTHWPEHVWVGTSVGDPRSVGKLDDLVKVPAKTRVVSAEPMLNEVDMSPWLQMRNADGTPAITMVVVGGESGPRATPMHVSWIRKIREACEANGVLFHFKQHGEWLHESQRDNADVVLDKALEQYKEHRWPDGTASYRVGNGKAGHLLDGERLQERPNPRGVVRLPMAVDEVKAAPVTGEPARPRERALNKLDETAEKALAGTSAEIIRDAEKLLGESDILARVVSDVQADGVAGEGDLISVLYLAYTSRLLNKPLSAIVRGTSSSGKSFVVDRVSRLIPDESIVRGTDLTPNSLYYMEQGALVHRLVLGGERRRGKFEASEATRALREMLSAGELRKAVPRMVNGQPTTRLLFQPGPIAFVETTTLTEIFDEDENRCILLSSNESPEQTAAVLRKQAELAVGNVGAPRKRRQVHVAAQRMLKRVRVSIPFAKRLADDFPTNAAQARRAFGQLLALIEASATLNQRQRASQPLNHGDVIEATIADYSIAKRLFSRPLQYVMGGGLSDALVRFARWLDEKMAGGEFTVADVRATSDAPLTSRDKINGAARKLADAGLLIVVEQGRGSRPTIWKRTAATIDDGACEWLPEAESLAA